MGGYGWFGTAEHIATGENLPLNRMGGFVKGKFDKFRGAVEVITAGTDYLVNPAVNNDTDTKGSFGLMVQGIYSINEKYEALVRYESYDDNTDADDDGVSWITGGFNIYSPAKGTMIYINYITKMEETVDIDDDVVQIQFQVSF